MSSDDFGEGFLAAMVSSSKVAVVSFNPSPKILQAISYSLDPDQYLPYVCWGEIHKNDKQTVCLLAAYGLAVEVLEFAIEEEITCAVSYHINLEISPVCVEFLRPNLFAVVDRFNMIHIIHIDDFEEGPSSSRTGKSSSSNTHYIDQLEGELLPHNFITSEPQTYELYHRTCLFIPQTATFYQICTKGFSAVKLYNEIEFLDAIFQKGEYRRFLTVAAELLNGNIKEVYTVSKTSPSYLLFRNDTKLYEYITQKILSCVYNQLLKGHEDKEDYVPNPKLVLRTAQAIIDFCLQVNILEFLFTEVTKSFELMKLSDSFFEALEPFVLLNRVQWMPDTQLKQFIAYLKQNDKIMTLQRLFLGFSVKEFNINSLIELCIEEKLTFSLIYICTRGNNDYITPLQKLLELMLDCAENYSNEDAQKDCLNALWYIKKCLQNRKLYSRLPIQLDTWKELVVEVAIMTLKHVESFIELCPCEFVSICLLLFQGKVAEQLRDVQVKDPSIAPEEISTAPSESLLGLMYTKVKEGLKNIIFSGSNSHMDEKQQKASSCLYFFIAALAEMQTWRMMPLDLILQCVRDLLDQPDLISNELMLFYYKAQRPTLDECSGNLEKLVEQEVDDNLYISRKDHLVAALVKYSAELIKSDREILDELETIADTSP